MGIFGNKYPYTDFHQMNLDWILTEIATMKTEFGDFISQNSIKYANPIQWDITRQYEKNTVVVDTDGIGYLSVQAVPLGISIDRTEFWTVIGNFSELLWGTVKKSITPEDEGDSTTATKPRIVGDLVWLDEDLIEVTENMSVGVTYVIGNNCRKYSMQILLNELKNAINDEIDARTSADADLQTNINNEVTARQTADTSLQTNINNEVTARQTADTLLDDKIEAIKSIYVNILDYGAVGDGIVDDTISIQNAINDAYNNSVAGTIFIPKGVYNVTQLNNNNGVNIIGEGRHSKLCGTDNSKSVIYSTQDYSNVQYKDFSITRLTPATLDSGGHGLQCTSTGYNFRISGLHIEKCDKGIYLQSTIAGAWIDTCFVENNAGVGFHVVTPNMNITNCYSQKNGVDGFRFNNSAGLFLNRCEAYRNKGVGFNLKADAGQSINDVIMTNCVCSTNKSAGIVLDTNGSNIKLQGIFAEYSGYEDESQSPVVASNGITVSSRNVNVEIDAQCVWNSKHGLQILCNGFIVTGVYAANSLFSVGTYYGISIPQSNDNFIIHDAICAPTNSFQNTQGYGIVLEGSPTDFIITNCITKGNVNGDKIYYVKTTSGVIKNCIGTNPVGLLTAPAIPSSTVEIVNPYPFDCTIIISGGTVTNIKKAFVSLGITSGVIRLCAKESISITYSVAPTWVWIGE